MKLGTCDASIRTMAPPGRNIGSGASTSDSLAPGFSNLSARILASSTMMHYGTIRAETSSTSRFREM